MTTAAVNSRKAIRDESSGADIRQTLASLSAGESCSVLALQSCDNQEGMQRLLSLGIYPGVKLTLLRSAPLGDPLQIKVGQTLVSLRKCDAEIIEIALDTSPNSTSANQVAI